MALRTKWTVRLEGVETRLALAGRTGTPLHVSLVINGLAPDRPGGIADCLDFEPIRAWITEQWPRSAPVPLLENRVNELLEFLFAFDKRVQDAWVGVYERGRAPRAFTVGVERHASRTQFQSRLRAARG